MDYSLSFVTRYKHVQPLGNLIHLVMSGDGRNTYTVKTVEEQCSMQQGLQQEGGGFRNVEHTWDCKAFAFHKNGCKHIIAVRIFMGISQEAKEAKHDIPTCNRPSKEVCLLALMTIVKMLFVDIFRSHFTEHNYFPSHLRLGRKSSAA